MSKTLAALVFQFLVLRRTTIKNGKICYLRYNYYDYYYYYEVSVYLYEDEEKKNESIHLFNIVFNVSHSLWIL